MVGRDCLPVWIDPDLFSPKVMSPYLPYYCPSVTISIAQMQLLHGRKEPTEIPVNSPVFRCILIFLHPVAMAPYDN